MTTGLTAAVIGTGNIARYHLAALREIPGVSVAAVCDLSAAAAEATAERYGVKAWYTDHRLLLEEVRPDVVHVTASPQAHYRLAWDALDAGANVIVEKPAATSYADVEALVDRARAHQRWLVEDYTAVFSAPVRRLLALVDSGDAGRVAHVGVTLCVDLGGVGGVADFAPHLASLATAFVGEAGDVTVVRRGDQELRALVDGERATATVLFSASARPDSFLVRLDATRLRATANVFEPGVVLERERSSLSRPLVPVMNGMEQSWTLGSSALKSFWGKLNGGPGSYEGLWELVRRTYQALDAGQPPPVSAEQILQVHRLVTKLTAGA